MRMSILILLFITLITSSCSFTLAMMKGKGKTSHSSKSSKTSSTPTPDTLSSILNEIHTFFTPFKYRLEDIQSGRVRVKGTLVEKVQDRHVYLRIMKPFSFAIIQSTLQQSPNLVAGGMDSGVHTVYVENGQPVMEALGLADPQIQNYNMEMEYRVDMWYKKSGSMGGYVFVTIPLDRS